MQLLSPLSEPALVFFETFILSQFSQPDNVKLTTQPTFKEEL